MIWSLGNESLSDGTQKLDPYIGMYGCGKHLGLVKGFIHECKMSTLDVSEVGLQH